MEYELLGKSTLRVSRIGFGCMSLQDNQKYNIELLHEAFDMGINFFDTADLYQKGLNEETLGNAFRQKRKKVIIASKAGNQWRPDGTGWDWNPRKEYILECAEKSLQRLQTDYIDLYQLHGGTINDPIDETIEAFEILKQQGKILHYGISSIRPNVIREYVKRSNIVSVMMQYSLLDRRPEEACLALLLEHKIGVLARGSLANGLLAGKPSTNYLNYNSQDVATAASAIKTAAGKNSLSQIATRFVLDHPAITSSVVGIRTKDQLFALAGIPNRRLPQNDYLRLVESIPVNYYDNHR
jgi:aryl-alcohol dehydrogenase-like predicted oxidoreductase